jgi:hypothetical protein
MDFFWHFPILLTDDCIVFCLVLIVLVAIKDWIKDLLIYLYKMIKNHTYFRIQINHVVFNLWKWKKSRSILFGMPQQTSFFKCGSSQLWIYDWRIVRPIDDYVAYFKLNFTTINLKKVQIRGGCLSTGVVGTNRKMVCHRDLDWVTQIFW